MNDLDNIIRIKDLSVNYCEKSVLDKISLNIGRGEHVALIGPSGVGKTTLLKKLYHMLDSNASFIHQNYSLVPQLSVFHNIYIGRLDYYSTFYNLLNLFVPVNREKEKIRQIAKILEIDDYLFQVTSKLSGGEQQRVAIGRALFKKSNVILADEPVSSLDPEKSKSVLNILTNENQTTISALHNIKQAGEHFTRFIGLKNRRILFDLPREMVTESDLKELYAT